MGEKRVTRGALTATIQVAAALTRDGKGGTSTPKVPAGVSKLKRIEVAFAGEHTLAITENVLLLELGGDAFSGGPYTMVIGSLSGSGTTSGQGIQNVPTRAIECNIDVVAGADMNCNVIADGDTLIVSYAFATFVFE